MSDGITLIDNLSPITAAREYFISRDCALSDKNGLCITQHPNYHLLNSSGSFGVLKGSQPIFRWEVYLFGRRMFSKKYPRPFIGHIKFKNGNGEVSGGCSSVEIVVYGRDNISFFKEFADVLTSQFHILATIHLKTEQPSSEVFQVFIDQ